MRRREVIALLSGVAAWPRASRAQAPERRRRVGVILGLAEGDPEGEARLTAFRQGLHALGWVEGRNIEIGVRFAAGEAARAQAVARELLRTGPEMVLATSGPVVAALQRESDGVPIVFVHVVDPVGRGLVDSLARPGRNVTGLTHFEPAMGGKWLALLKEMAPATARVAFLYSPDTAARGAGSAVYLQSFEKLRRSACGRARADAGPRRRRAPPCARCLRKRAERRHPRAARHLQHQPPRGDRQTPRSATASRPSSPTATTWPAAG